MSVREALASIGFSMLLAALFIVGSCRTAAAQGIEDKVFTVSEWAVLAGHAFDAAATQRCLGSGRCREVNPWLARYDSPVRFTAAKMTVAGLQLWAVRRLRPSHPRLATVTNYAIAAGFTAIAVRNERVGR
jgi:hypothetical protein